MNRGSMKVLGGAAAAGTGSLALYLWMLRPWQQHWGASNTEATELLPGDDIVWDPTFVTTRAVTIHARPEAVWPWLVQLGLGRGGFYNYTWVERLLGLNVSNADQVLPAFQELKVGDAIPLGGGLEWPVKALEPNRLLVLAADDATATWAFVLRPLENGATRLICRWRMKLPPTVTGAMWTAVLDPGEFIMERKMLLGIKERAERTTLLDQVLPEYEFRDAVSVVIHAPPSQILQAAREVTLAEMPVAWALGTLRYLPGRLLGRGPVESQPGQPFIPQLIAGGTVVLAEEPEREIVLGGIGKFHNLADQQPVHFGDLEQFAAFNDPEYQKLVMSLRLTGRDLVEGYTLTLEHRTHALSEESRRKFTLYWLGIKPGRAFVSSLLLQAVKRRAETAFQKWVAVSAP